MNPEKFPIKKEPQEFKVSESGYTFNESDIEKSLTRYDEFVTKKLNEAMEIKQELEDLRKQRREKNETFDFEKWNSLEFNLKQKAREIITQAKTLDAHFDMHVERPSFAETLGEPDLDNLEEEINRLAERKAA